MGEMRKRRRRGNERRARIQKEGAEERRKNSVGRTKSRRWRQTVGGERRIKVGRRRKKAEVQMRAARRKGEGGKGHEDDERRDMK